MIGHGEKLSRKQEDAIGALLTHSTISQAAKSCGVSDVQLARWMKEPAFDEAYRQARREAVNAAIGLLQKASGAATATLLSVMANAETPASVRVSAAKTVLEMAFKAIELEDFEERLAVLEATLDAKEERGNRK